MDQTAPDPTAALRQRIETALGERFTGPGLHRTPAEQRHDQGMFVVFDAPDGGRAIRGVTPAEAAAVLLPLVADHAAQERAAGRADGLREAAAALQNVIDRDRAHPHQRAQSWIALGGAREIILGLIDARADAAQDRNGK